MSLFHDSALVGASGQAGGAGYSISRSIRLNPADSAYLSRTPASAGNRKTWTWAGWVKRSKLGARYALFAAGSDGCEFFFEQSVGADKLHFYYYNNSASAYQGQCITTGLFRDPSAWYHVVLAVDTTQSTASNRCKIYVNGVEQATSFTTNFGSSADLDVNNTVNHKIGGSNSGGGAFSFDGYLADIHFIDGQALTPSSFGEFSATTGVWVPKAYSGGSYGTNGFHLDFADNSAATAAALGKDTSGAGNNWTPSNLSVTAGAGNDSLVDVPTNGSEVDTGSGGQVRGNYCTWNPLDKSGSPIYSNGNLDAFTGASGYGTTRGTIAVSSGKWYWECTFNSTDASNDCYFGILDITGSLADNLGGNAKGYAYWGFNGNKVHNGSSSAYGSSYAPGDVIGVALNLDAGSITFYKNGVSQGTAFSSLSGTFAAAFSDSGGSSIGLTGNFGQRPFAYTAPSGFKALNTSSLPSPLVTKPSTVFDVKLYTGNGGTQTISGLGFSPDFLWIKARSNSGYQHVLQDVVRGAGKSLFSSLTSQEIGNAGDFVGSFNSDGFSVTNNYNGGTAPETNGSGSTYAAWCWDAGATTVTDNTGSIQSTRRTNASAGFSVVSWSTNSSSGNATIGHGLNVAPKLIIMKSRNASYNWDIYHGGISNAKDGRLIFTTDAFTTAVTPFGGVDPTSSVFTMSQSFYGSGINCVAYCFAPVVGYSSFGSYTGNGSADGPFVFCGFRPRWLLFKNTNVAGQYWDIYDTARDTYNASGLRLFPNASDAENDARPEYDILSNGFKVRDSSTSANGNGNTIIYAAFAESPFAANNRAR